MSTGSRNIGSIVSMVMSTDSIHRSSVSTGSRNIGGIVSMVMSTDTT